MKNIQNLFRSHLKSNYHIRMQWIVELKGCHIVIDVEWKVWCFSQACRLYTSKQTNEIKHTHKQLIAYSRHISTQLWQNNAIFAQSELRTNVNLVHVFNAGHCIPFNHLQRRAKLGGCRVDQNLCHNRRWIVNRCAK